MVILELLFILALQGECSIKIPLTRKINTKSRELTTLPTEDKLKTYMGFTYYYFLANFSVGTPPQYFTVGIHSEDSIFYLETKPCDKCPSYFLNKFDPSASSTYEEIDDSFGYHPDIFYLHNSSYEFDIIVSKDIMKFGNEETKQYLALLTFPFESDFKFNFSVYDGALGLSLRKSNYDFPTFIDSLKSAGIIDKKLYSLYTSKVYLNSSFEIEDYPSSHLEFGDYDLETYSSTGKILVTIPITMDDYIGSYSFDIYFDGVKLNADGGLAFSIGVYYMGAQKTDFYEIFNHLTNTLAHNCTLDYLESSFSCICDDVYSMPSMYFKYKEVSFLLNQSELWAKKDDICISHILKSYDDHWHIGDILLSKYYAIFDFDNNEISLAPAALEVIEKEEDITSSKGIYIAVAFSLLALS
ncbi:hypothetical protein SteCoe_27188 [Stentor coeruleus]|uniref:Peptidase A1 domain-containing protein n=1 Tax=Stentor coeruleus TaxID=5963 RepID=A0A1R2BB80_9CILI|nr:hypothetical protein SteCoe_27188 [Stentor coeruleus]